MNIGHGTISISGQEIGTIESIYVAIDTPEVQGRETTYPITDEEAVNLIEKLNSWSPFYPSFACSYKPVYSPFNFCPKLTIGPAPIRPYNRPLPLLVETNPLPLVKESYFPMPYLLEPEPKIKKVKPGRLIKKEKRERSHKQKRKLDKKFPSIFKKTGRTKNKNLNTETLFDFIQKKGPKWWIDKDLKEIVSISKKIRLLEEAIRNLDEAKQALNEIFNPSCQCIYHPDQNYHFSLEQLEAGQKAIQEAVKIGEIIVGSTVERILNTAFICDGCFTIKELVVKRTCEECGNGLKHCKECGEEKGNICYYCGIKHLNRGEV